MCETPEETRLREIKEHWQFGISPESLRDPWYRKMAELVGDEEGLKEFAELETRLSRWR